MKVTEHIQKENSKTQFSFEILPPLKGKIFKEYLTLSKSKYFVEDLECFRNFEIFNTKTLR